MHTRLSLSARVNFKCESSITHSVPKFTLIYMYTWSLNYTLHHNNAMFYLFLELKISAKFALKWTMILIHRVELIT